MKAKDITKEVYKNPAKPILLMGLLILVADFLIEYLLVILPFRNAYISALADGVLLLALLAPAMYYIFFRPMVRYISEIKRAENELRKEKNFNENLLKTAKVIIVGMDTDGKVNLLSRGIESITGYSQEELMGKDWFDVIVPKSRYPRAWEEFKNIKQTGEVAKIFESPVLTKSGVEKFISWQNGEVIEDNKSVGIISFGIDITDKKKAELEMMIRIEIDNASRQSEDLGVLLALVNKSLKKVMYAENCFFALYDHKKGLFSFPYFEDLFDEAPPQTDLSKSCTSYVFRSGISTIIDAEKFQQLIDSKEIELIGSACPSWIGVPLRTSSKIVGVLVLQHYEKENVYNEDDLKFLDSIANHVATVIERRQAEDELGISYSLLEATLESTADGILVVNKNGEITNYNKKFTELWRIPESIIATKDDHITISYVLDQLKFPDKFLNQVDELYTNDAEISMDIIEFKDGRIFERYSQAQVFKGQNVGRVWSFRNITEQKNMLRSLSESEARLRDLNATKDKFFSIIAHDLKSPFNGILGFSDILVSQIKEKDFDGVEEFGEIIHQSSQRAMDLLTNLIEWSRAESGRMDFNPEFVDLTTLVNGIFELSNVSAIHKSIRLEKEIPKHISVFLDKRMIGSVIRNLISNAIKFTHPEGKVIFRAEQAEHELVISVSDNGVGITDKNLARLFRIDESYSVPGTQNEKGTGLGLILCKEFVEKHGGKIWVESKPGQGSTFYFTIPKF